MTELFDAVSARLKAIFLAHAALELEGELILRHAERKALLLRRANELEKEGLADLADEMRQHAARLDPQRPAEAVLPALTGPTKSEPEKGDGEAVAGGVVTTRKKAR